MLARSISQQKAARVRLETGPPSAGGLTVHVHAADGRETMVWRPSRDGEQCGLPPGASYVVTHHTGPPPRPPLETRLTALAARWEMAADWHAGGGPGEGTAADTLRECVRELRDELER
jgi:hypothetical protein